MMHVSHACFLFYHPWGQIFYSGLRSKTPGSMAFPLEPRFTSTHTKRTKQVIVAYILISHLCGQ